MDANQPLLPPHGGYRKLRSFQVAQLVYDVTVRFCDRYVDRRSRTHDQMVQAARSGVQNVAEGSQASATSKKFELKLTQVARASLEELKLDYEDYLRQRGLARWGRDDPLRQELIDARPETADDVAGWVRGVHERLAGSVGKSGHSGRSGRSGPGAPSAPGRSPSASSSASPSSTSPPRYAELAANAALALATVAGYLLDRQVARLAEDFERQGGFTERLHRVRSGARRRGPR